MSQTTIQLVISDCIAQSIFQVLDDDQIDMDHKNLNCCIPPNKKQLKFTDQDEFYHHA